MVKGEIPLELLKINGATVNFRIVQCVCVEYQQNFEVLAENVLHLGYRTVA